MRSLFLLAYQKNVKYIMLDITNIRSKVEDFLKDTDAFPVSVTVDKENNVTVEIDAETGVDLETCEALNRELQQMLDLTPDADNYALEVGSAGLTSPFKVARQFVKYDGKPVVVYTRDGRRVHGVMSDVQLLDGGDVAFEVSFTRREKAPGEKRPRQVKVTEPFRFSEVNRVEYDLDADPA